MNWLYKSYNKETRKVKLHWYVNVGIVIVWLAIAYWLGR